MQGKNYSWSAGKYIFPCALRVT